MIAWFPALGDKLKMVIAWFPAVIIGFNLICENENAVKTKLAIHVKLARQRLLSRALKIFYPLFGKKWWYLKG
jgi:hypothetical protein